MPVKQVDPCAGVKFRNGPLLPAERVRPDRSLLDPAAAQDSVRGHLPRLSATDQITDPMVSNTPINGSISEAWT